MKSFLKILYCINLLLSFVHLVDVPLRVGVNEPQQQIMRPMIMVPVDASTFMPPQPMTQMFDPSAFYRYPVYNNHPMMQPPFERRLEGEQAVQPEVKQEQAPLEKPPAQSWWQEDKEKEVVQRTLELKTDKEIKEQPKQEIKQVKSTKPKTKKTKKSKKERMLTELKPEQKALALQVKPFLEQLKKSKTEKLEDIRKLFDQTFSQDNQFFLSNFWPIVEKNYNEQAPVKFPLKKLEDKISSAIFRMKFDRKLPEFLKKSKFFKKKSVFISKKQVSDFFRKLELERELSSDGSDSLNGFQLRPDFEQKFELLQVLYKSETVIFKDKTKKPEVIQGLRKYDIDSYDKFKVTIDSVLEYFLTIISQYKLHKAQILNNDLHRMMDSVNRMIKGIRNRILGLFFYKYINLFTNLRIKKNNPTFQQKQTLRIMIIKIIQQIGVNKFAATVFRIIHQIRTFKEIRVNGVEDRPPSFSVFEQIFQNQVKSASLRFLIQFYFESLDEKIRNIENLIFMNRPQLLNVIKFDFKRLFYDVVNSYSITDFQEFNQVVFRIDQQIGLVFKKAPVKPSQSYFGQFVKIYSRISFESFGRYFYLSKPSKQFYGYVQDYNIDRQFYPINFQALNPGVQPPVNHITSDEVEKKGNERIQKVIFDLSQYLEDKNDIIFTSEAEREKILRLIDSILSDRDSVVLSKKSLSMINQLKDKVNRSNNKRMIKKQIVSVEELNREITIFKNKLSSIVPIKSSSQVNIRISLLTLEKAASITNLLVEFFKKNTVDENAYLLSIATPFFEMHEISSELDLQLNRVYKASDSYTQFYDDLFDDSELENARKLWKILLLYYSKSCHIELYKSLTVKIHMLRDKREFENIKISKLTRIFENMMIFLTKNQDFEPAKDCEEISKLILKKHFLSESIIKRSFLLNSFKKIFLKFGKGAEMGSGNLPLELMMKAQYLGQNWLKKKDDKRDISAEFYPNFVVGAPRMKNPPSKTKGDDDEPPGDTPDGDKPKPGPNPNPDPDPSKLLIQLLKFYLSKYGSFKHFGDNFDWNLFLQNMKDGDKQYLIKLLKIYGGDPSKITDEHSLSILAKFNEILLSVNPPSLNPPNFQIDVRINKITPPPIKEIPNGPPENKEKENEQNISFASSVVQAFYHSYSQKNDIPLSHKRMKFKLTSKAFNYLLKLKKRYPESPPIDIITSHPTVFPRLKKVLFYMGVKHPENEKPPEKKEDPENPPEKEDSDKPPEKKEEIPEELKREFLSFKKNTLVNYFNNKLRKGCPNPQFLAKRVFMHTPSLENRLKVSFKKREPIPEEELDQYVSEFRFYDKVVSRFYKNTDYLNVNKDSKKITGRLFLKKLPKSKRQFLQSVYNKFKNLKNYIKKGPTAKVNQMLRRVQFNIQKKCQTSCKSKCYKIVGGERIELTEEEKKQYAANFPCSQTSNELSFLDLNGNAVSEEGQASYGCGCSCGGGKGGIQINDKPYLNFNMNFENREDAKMFQEFLKNSDFLNKIKDTSAIDMDKLKAKYQQSKLDGMFTIDMKHTPFKNGFDVDKDEDDGQGNENTMSSLYGVSNDFKAATPMNLGLPPFDDSGQPIIPGKPYILNGQRFDPRSGKLLSPFLFQASNNGDIETYQTPDGRGKQKMYTFKQQVTRDNGTPKDKYPVFYPLSSYLAGEQLNEEQAKNMKDIMSTLKVRYPIANDSVYQRKLEAVPNPQDLPGVPNKLGVKVAMPKERNSLI